jgi:hypothetical protein
MGKDSRSQEKEDDPRQEECEPADPIFGLNRFENSITYRKNEKTGEWEIVNPAGAVAYNYLYREDKE